MEDFAFVEACEDDLPAILDIYNHYVQNSTATFRTEPLTMPELKSFVFLNHERYKSYLIRDRSGETCGFCLLTQYRDRQAYSRTGEISVYLKTGFTGRRIGQLAVEHIERAARQSNIRVLIAVITAENTASVRLFERLGYEKCAHYKQVGELDGRLLDVVAYQKFM